MIEEVVGLEPPFASFPSASYNSVNERMSRRVNANKSAWHGFAAAWNGVAYRLIASHHHAAKLRMLLATGATTPQVRFEQDHEMFGCAASMQSVIECAMFAVEIVTVTKGGSSFRPTADKELRFRPDEVVNQVAKNFPTARISRVIEIRLRSPEFSKISDLRRVLFHRGTLPRNIHLRVGGPGPDVDTIPSNPADPAERWRYDLYLEPEMLDSALAWCNSAAAEIIEALYEFTTGW